MIILRQFSQNYIDCWLDSISTISLYVHTCDAHVIPRPLIDVNVAVETDRLPTGDDITSPDNETEQNDVASDVNIVSGSDSGDD